jgi:hypothetical protein
MSYPALQEVTAHPGESPREAKNTLIESLQEDGRKCLSHKACNDRASIIDMKFGDEYKKMLEEQEEMFKVIWEESQGPVSGQVDTVPLQNGRRRAVLTRRLYNRSELDPGPLR